MDELCEQVAEAAPTALLPERLRADDAHLPLHLTLADATPLAGVDAALVVLRDENDSLLAAPVVDAAGSGRGVQRAVPGDGAAHALATALLRREALVGAGFTTTALVADDAGPAPDATERPMLVDQTHESVVVGEQAVVKWAVHAEPTPASVLVPHLAAAGFAQMPPPWGFVTWQDRPAAVAPEPVLLASVMGFLPGASDGWTWAVQDVGDAATGRADLTSALAPMGTVGTLVADLHGALATATSVIPEPRAHADSVEVTRWRMLADGLLAEALSLVDGPEGARLLQRRDRIAQVFAGLAGMDGSATIPVHGDLHIGQVLRWSGGYAVGDFDGNPVLPVVERLRPQPAARDVAGMLQSIDHVGRVVVRRVEGSDPDLVERWIGQAQQAFLTAYRARLAHHGVADLLDERLLLPFRVEQECREFLYAVRHLPRWRYVPDQALQALLPGS